MQETQHHTNNKPQQKDKGILYFEDMAVGIMEQQISVRLIGYKAENRWVLAYRIRQQAVSFRYCLFPYI